MPAAPTLDEVRTYVMFVMKDNPTGASSRFALAEGLRTRFGVEDSEAARSLVGRALSALQDAHQVEVLAPESWDLSGDERVRLVREPRP